MNPSDTAILEQPTELDERFRYGWRDVRRRLPDGSYTLLQLPLTAFDVLHPQEGDKLMHSNRHETEQQYFSTVLKDHYQGDASVLILGDVGVYWDFPGLGHHSPDLSVIFNVDRPRDLWTSFHVAQEGVRPVLIVEIVSPSTRETDIVTKLEAYHRAEVACYVVIDRVQQDDPPTPLVYRWTADQYVLVEPDSEGRVLLEPVDLLLGLVENRVALFDAETEEELGDYSAIRAALTAERVARREAEERAIAEEKARREAEERANGAEARAAEAEQRAAEMEQRFRELEERLRHRNGPNGTAVS